MGRIRIDFSFLSMVAVLGWLNGKICLCFLISVCVHELGHILALTITGGKIGSIRFTCMGAEILARQIGSTRKLLCSLSGPAAGLALSMVFMTAFPELAIISLCLSVFNLLPLYPLDGGVILFILLHNVRRKDRILHLTTITVCCLLMTAACWLTVKKQAGLWPIFLSLILLYRAGEQEKELLFRKEKDTIE